MSHHNEPEIPDFDDRPWTGPYDGDPAVNPFAELTDDCKRVLSDRFSSDRRKRAASALALLTDA